MVFYIYQNIFISYFAYIFYIINNVWDNFKYGYRSVIDLSAAGEYEHKFTWILVTRRQVFITMLYHICQV